MGVTKVKLKRSFSNGNLNIIQALSAASNMTLAFGEPVWFKNTFYGGEKLFVADDSGAPVFIGPYRGSEYININNDPTSANLGTISLNSNIEVQSLNVTQELYAENLSSVAYSGAYSDLIGRPTNVSSFTNDVGYLTNSTLPSDLFYVTFTKAVHSNGSVISSKTYDEINTAINAGKLVIATYTPDVTGAMQQYFIAPVAEDSNTLLFTNISPNDRNEMLFIRVTSSAVTLTIDKDYNIPDVTGHDGKVLIADETNDSVYWGNPHGIDTISSGGTTHQVANNDDIEFKTVNGSSILGNGDIAVGLDFERVMNLIADTQMSDILNNTTCNNANLLLKIDVDRVVSMDKWANHETYVVINNTSSSPHTITFDYSGEGIVAFVGSGEYIVNDSALQVAVPASSHATISMRVMDGKAVLFSVERVRMKGVPVTEAELADDDVALVISTSDGLRYIAVDDISVYNIDLTQYTLKPFVRFTRGRNGKAVVMHKTTTSGQWALNNYYKVYCDTTAAGGFTITVGNWETSTSATVSWSAGATLDSIVAQMTNGSYCWFSHESGEDFIRVNAYTSSSSYTCTLTNNTGGTVEDLSKYCRINGVVQSEVHRVWQGTDVASLFPSFGFVPANSAQYAKNGYNMSWMCGANLARYKAYYGASGASSYVAESSVATRMTAAAFAALNNSGVAEQQALYDKYNGSWDAYMGASMIQIDDTHTSGIEYQSYDNGEQSKLLASVETKDFAGNWVPAYPAAYNAAQLVDANIGACNLPTNHEIAVFIEDSKFAKINTAMSYINGDALSNTAYYWSVAQYYSSFAWFYYGYTGKLDYYYKSNTTSIRALAYLS